MSAHTFLRRAGECTLLATMLTACPKSNDGAKPSPSSSTASATDAGPPTTAASTEAGAPAAAASAASAAATYTGTYTLAPATIHIAEGKDYAHVKQAKDDPTKLVGPGTLTLSVDATGRIGGSVDTGPASPAIIDGSLVDGELRGTVRRKTPSDDGLVGTLVGKITGATAAGTLSLSEANAAIVRDGPITLTRK